MNKTLEELQADLAEARAELDVAEAVLNSRLYVDNPFSYSAVVKHIKAKVEALKEKANEN